MASLLTRLTIAYLVFVVPSVFIASVIASNLGGSAAVYIAVFLVTALVTSILMAWTVAREITRPLARLRAAFDEGAGGAPAESKATIVHRDIDNLTLTVNDMTGSLRQRMQALEQARSRLEALLASSQDGIAALDAHGSVRYLNPAAIALYGSIEGRSFAEVARDPEITRLLRGVLPGRTEPTPAGSGHTAIVHIEDRNVWVQCAASAIAGGGDWAVLLVLHDITEVRRAETTRRDFVANVSHELRTPLAGIKAVVETLRDGALEDREAADQFLGQVENEVDRLVQLVEELLQLARIESATEVAMLPVDLHEILVVCLDRYTPQAERAGVMLELDDAARLPEIEANAAQLGQAFGNLVHNAIKFTPPGGSVTVSAVALDNTVRIAVSDTGAGIDPADLPRIFERFYVGDRARSARGTGLGLAIVKHVVLAHGGSVQAQSVLGRGSTFTVMLPVRPAEAAGRRSASSPAAVQQR
jgi:two-component system, OmpR family, phosphate regulon sensor histidine kinase PhoR